MLSRITEGKHAIPAQPFGFNDPERHANAMREVSEVITLTGDNEQRFSGLYVNRDFSSAPLIAEPSQMFASCKSDEVKYIALQQAAANPEHPILIWDMPSHGDSYNLTPEQRRQIYIDREMGLLAHSQATAIRNHSSGFNKLILTGKSLGARIIPDLAIEASQFDIETQMIIGFEMVGLEERLSASVGAAFLITEAIKSRKNYTNNPRYSQLFKAYEDGFKKDLRKYSPEDNYKMISVYENDPSLLLFLLARSPLAADTGQKSLEKALDKDQNLQVSLVFGGLSSVCRLRKIQPVVDAIKRDFPDRFNYDIWPNDSHGMSLAPLQPQISKYTKKCLDQLGDSS
jgi:hypothetical protein